jgi:hypothetical protein
MDKSPTVGNLPNCLPAAIKFRGRLVLAPELPIEPSQPLAMRTGFAHGDQPQPDLDNVGKRGCSARVRASVAETFP